MHLATWMPFAHAAHLLATLTGVQVSEATIRRHSEQAGNVCETLQNEPEQQSAGNEARPEDAPYRIVLSADGAFVSLVRGVWSEVRTLAIGEVTQTEGQTKTTKLSSFSRMTDATHFEQLIEAEMSRRQVPDA
ncbi:MAG TPA: hypothetical protein VN729_05345 [Ktedonobacteraceae bacterium]|nr:hypothetical protein [Ktedonobacteraceae bacterium]